jgi:hypothetical protein
VNYCCVYAKWEDLGQTDFIRHFVPTARSYYAIDGIWHLWKAKNPAAPGFQSVDINLCEEHHFDCMLRFLGESADLSI